MMPWLSWAQNNELLALVAPLVGIFLFRELILRKISRYQTIYYAVLFPGVIIHEIGHLLGCLITLTRVKAVKFFSKTGGVVVHEKPRIEFLGEFIISIMPLALGLFLSYLIINNIYFKNGLIMLPSTIIFSYFLLSIIMTMLPSITDIRSSLPAYLAVLVLLVIFHKSIKIPSFKTVWQLLAILLILEVIIYFLILAFGQNRFFKVK